MYPRSGASAWGSLLGRLVVALTSAICLAFLTLPLLALLLRVPLADLPRYLSDSIVLDALRLSLVSSLCSLALMLVLGTPVAYGLARSTFPGKRIVETLVELPLVLPPAVAGVALLFAFGRRTPLGGVLRELNVEVAFTLAAVVMAQAFVAAPFYIRAARAGFQSVPHELVEAAQTQGADGMQTFRHIIVPLALPGIAGGAVMGWARAVGEFGATILFAGNFQGRTQTMPLAIYTALETDINAAIVLAGILVVASFALLITFKLLSGRQLDVVGLGE
jgi:molybdate transport system permease protein